MNTNEAIPTEVDPPPELSIWTRFGRANAIEIDPAPYLRGNDIFGRLLGSVLLALSLPVIAVLILLVRMTSRGPGLYRQVRVGKEGHIFVMYKLRSMVQDAESEIGPVWTQGTDDPRITPVGTFLRMSHLDELPQLLNVARGEMALFGPRPERPELVHILADHIPNYLDRLAVKPGITGLAQINLPPDSDLESVRRKLTLDLEYITTANVWMECRMFIWTLMRLIAIPASIATRTCGLNRNVKPVKPKSKGPVALANVLDTQPLNDEPMFPYMVD